jgi:hypothetical protein
MIVKNGPDRYTGVASAPTPRRARVWTAITPPDALEGAGE